jgi:hypothetical protein
MTWLMNAALNHPHAPICALQVVEGILLFLGSLGVIIALLTLPYDGPRTFQIILPVTIIASLLEAAAVGAVVRPLNLKMRQSMGRTFGFNLDIFTNIGTVASLGISNLLQSDYARFASDVAAGTCRLALMGSAHRCFTTAMASAMRLLFLWQGGYQVSGRAEHWGSFWLFACLEGCLTRASICRLPTRRGVKASKWGHFCCKLSTEFDSASCGSLALALPTLLPGQAPRASTCGGPHHRS